MEAFVSVWSARGMQSNARLLLKSDHFRHYRVGLNDLIVEFGEVVSTSRKMLPNQFSKSAADAGLCHKHPVNFIGHEDTAGSGLGRGGGKEPADVVYADMRQLFRGYTARCGNEA